MVCIRISPAKRNETWRHLKYAVFLIISCNVLLICPILAETPILNINPVKVKSGIYNLQTHDYAFILYDKTKEITFSTALLKLKGDQFKPYKKEHVPSKYSRGLYNNWIYIRLENIDTAQIFLNLNWSLIYDSIYIMENNKLIKKDYISSLPQKDPYGILNIGFVNIYYISIRPKQKLDIFIKNYDYAYGKGRNIPKVSDTNVFEAKYYFDNNNEILFTTSGVFVIITILFIFGFQWVFSRDKIYLCYCLYALSSLFVLWRNLEYLQPILYSTYYYLSWTDSKVYHSVAVFFTYMVFCAIFLEFNPLSLKRMIKILTWFCVIAVIVESFFLKGSVDLHSRWIFYQFVRLFLTTIGLVSLFLAFKSTHPLAKYIVAGGSLMALAEITSMIFHPSLSSTISLVGVFADFIIFSVALSIRSKTIELENLNLILQNVKLQSERETASSLLKNRIANDIHDELGLGLTSANYLLYNILNVNTNQDFKQDVQRVIGLNTTMVSQMHDIIWSMDESKDNIMEFCADLKAIFNGLRQYHQLSGQFKHNTENVDKKINGFIRRNVLMCQKEALNNAIKHGKPTEINVYLSWTKVNLSLQIKDNGIGFNESNSIDPMAGNGIRNIKKRVKDCGGKVSFYNDNGANVFIEIPL